MRIGRDRLRRTQARRGRALSLLLAFLPALGLATPRAVRAEDAATFGYADTGYATLDPARIRTCNDERLVLALYDCLTALDATTGDVVPAAAERWEESADGRTWTFHLRQGAVWSDGAPVRAQDFVAAWRRAIDPFEPSPWVDMFRALDGCGAITDGDRAMRALSKGASALQELAEKNGRGIPGDELHRAIESSGVRVFAAQIDDADVRRMLRWGGDPFPADSATAVVGLFRKERRARKEAVNQGFDHFGRDVGARVVDDRTLQVLVGGRTPWLPALLARAPFAPLHPETLKLADMAFEPGHLRTNGAYRLKGRGPKPRAGVPDPESVVNLEKSESYHGPRPGHYDEILAYTGLAAAEARRRFDAGGLRWIAGATKAMTEGLEQTGKLVRRPAGSVLLLRLRCDRRPFDQVEARRAFAQGLDRKALVGRVWPEAEVAERILPPGVEGLPAAGSSPRRDPGAAKALLTKIGMAGEAFPWAELRFGDTREQQELAQRLLAQWKAALGVDLGLRIETREEQQKVLAAGAYEVSLTELAGDVADPAGWLLRFHSRHPAGGLGWADDGLDHLLDAAADVDAFLGAGDGALAGLPDGGSGVRAQVERARSGGPKERESLRHALLLSAEARLLSECAVVPVCFPARADIVGAVGGLGSEAAWRNPVFAGSLRDVRP